MLTCIVTVSQALPCRVSGMSAACENQASRFFAFIQWKSCHGRKIRNAAELYCVIGTAHGNFKQCQNCFGYELWGGGRLASILKSHRRITPQNWSNRQKDSPVIPSPTAGLSFQRRNKENRRFPVQFIALDDSWQEQKFDKLDFSSILHAKPSETALPANRVVTRFLRGF